MFHRLSFRSLAFRVAALTVLLPGFGQVARAAVRLPHVLSSHAVLQRDRPIHIWGWASPGARLSAAFHGQSVAAEAGASGEWSLYLAPEKAGGPYTLTITGDGDATVLTDLLVGDVWLASGQSNMEMPLAGFPGSAVVKDADKEIAAAGNPKLRLLRIEHKSSDVPLNDIEQTWTECTPQTAAAFSAVAYFFGREIAAKENVPIGLIDTTWGGTPADSWVSMDTLGSDPALLPAFASRARFGDQQANLDSVVAAEKREDDAARAAGQPAPKHPWHPYEPSWRPAALYNGMIAPFAPLTLRGFLWYQGEANSAHDRAPYYGRLMEGLIRDWRSSFAQGNLPFLYVQISSFYSPGEDWGEVREQQRSDLAVANTAMAVSLDAGDAANVHPANKQAVGARLALAARAVSYGDRVEYSGPLFREVTSGAGADGEAYLRVWFDHADGLRAQGKALENFEVAGADGKFVPAEAKLDGETVVVRAAGVKAPRNVRYAWASAVDGSLYNAAGLPASTFRSGR